MISFAASFVRKCALTVHLVFAALWFGAAVALIMLVFARPSRLASDAELRVYCACVKLIDDFIIIGAANGTLLSGVFLSWRTSWGFFKWYWVSFKLLGTLAMVLFGALCLGPWVNLMHQLATSNGLKAVDTLSFQRAELQILCWGSGQIVLLLMIIAISVFKPWGRIPSRSISKLTD